MGYEEEEEARQSATIKFWVKRAAVAVLALVALAVLWPFSSVPTGSRGVITRFGQITDVEPEGLVLLWPWEKLSVFNIRAEAADIENAPGSTLDTQPVQVSLTVRYSIFPDKVSEVFEKYSHDGNLDSYVQTATMETFKAVTAKYVATDLITRRAQVSGDISELLKKKLSLYGAQVINIDMRNFSFSASYMAAINDKVTQEQLRLAAENKLRTVEAEQKQKVAVASAEAEAVKATADGQAYATIANAKAQAEDIRLRTQALREAGGAYLDLKRVVVEQTRAERWDGKLPEAVYAGAPIPFLDSSRKP